MPKWGWGIVSAALAGYKYFLADGSNDYVWAVKADLSDADQKADIYTLYNSLGNYYIAAPTVDDVAYWAYNNADPQYYDIRASQDSGATFPTDYPISVNEFTFVFDHGKIEMDVTNGTLWHPAGSGNAGDALSFDVSIDHGQTWTNTALRTIPASHNLAMFNITPRNDGSTAFVHTEYVQTVSPFSWDQGFIDLVDNTGSIIGTYSFTPSAIFNDPPGGPPYYGLYAIGCAKNSSNLFYGCAYNSGNLWQFDWDTSTWTLNTSYVPTQNQRLIYCSRTGTMFILEAPGSSPYFIMNRSADDGVTWSAVTIPVTGSDTQYLPMSMTVASDNQLAVPYNKNSFMSLMTSDDDGVNWTLNAVMPSLDAQGGSVTDLSGPTGAAPITNGIFFVALADGSVYAVTNVSPGSEAGATRGSLTSLTNIYAAKPGRVCAFVGDGSVFNQETYISTNGGTTFTVASGDSTWNSSPNDSWSPYPGSYFDQYALKFNKDVANPLIAIQVDLMPPLGYIYFWKTVNGGLNWQLAYSFGTLAMMNGMACCPAGDATNFFTYRSYLSGIPPTTVNKEVVHTTYGAYSVYGTIGAAEVSRMVCLVGDSTKVYFTTIGTGDLYVFDYTVPSLTQLQTGAIAYTEKQIISTQLGTLLWVDSDATHLVIRRSTDQGTSFTAIDLSASLPARPGSWAYDFIAVSDNNVLFLPLETGQGFVSTDDGATWNLSADFMPHQVAFDVSGTGTF